MSTNELRAEHTRLNDLVNRIEYRAHKASKSGKVFFRSDWDHALERTGIKLYETNRDLSASIQDDRECAAEVLPLPGAFEPRRRASDHTDAQQSEHHDDRHCHCHAARLVVAAGSPISVRTRACSQGG